MKLEGVPEGYEAVRFGKPKHGEVFLCDNGQVQKARYDFEKNTVLIVRKLEPVLDLSKVRLKKGWIAQDKNGSNYWFSERPRLAANHAAAEIFQALTLIPVGEVTLRCEPEPGAPAYVFSWRGRIDQKWYAIDQRYSTEQLCHLADVGVDYTRNVGERLREEIRERILELCRGLKVEGVGL